MYIQITTRCNMECEHCCMAAIAVGEDMNIETYKKAILYDEYITLGGGEPTLHPQFWEFIGLALGFGEYVWMATNGSITEIALVLAGMAKKGIMGCALSQDAYHDAIDERVIRAFTKEKPTRLDKDQREIRDVTGKEVIGGRCDFGDDGRCTCPGIMCKPNGDIIACGCDDAPIFGNINESIDIPDDWDSMECHKEQTVNVGG